MEHADPVGPPNPTDRSHRTEPPDAIVTVDAVAERLGVSRNAVLAAIRRGDLRAKKFSNRYGWRVREADYQAWLAVPTLTKRRGGQL